MSDDDPIIAAYSSARRLGFDGASEAEGYVPVLAAVDETLWECLNLNTGEDGEDGGFYDFDAAAAARYREKVLALPLQDGKAVLEEMIAVRREEAAEDDIDWDEELLGEMEGGEVNDRFAGIWNFSDRKDPAFDPGRNSGETSLGDLRVPAVWRLERMSGYAGTDGRGKILV